MAISGGSMWEPMAIAIISGLFISTALTLYVIPTLYYLYENFTLEHRLKKGESFPTYSIASARQNDFTETP